MNDIILTVIITLLIHSLIGTIIYIVTNENDDFAVYYAIGIIGWIVSGFCYLVRIIKRWYFNHDKRSILKMRMVINSTAKLNMQMILIGIMT